MRNSEFGRIGARSVFPNRATGMRGICISRERVNMSITSRHYGHPSKFGYKDICPLWKAERWDPDALAKLYKRAGAEYLVSLATHHDNFDCWNSKYQPWNCGNIGPKRDIVGTWQKVARANGLRFGVSYHGTPHRVWDEFLPVRYKSDITGPLAGVPYDGVQTMADGKGTWWQGMDPQMINGKPHRRAHHVRSSFSSSCFAFRM